MARELPVELMPCPEIIDTVLDPITDEPTQIRCGAVIVVDYLYDANSSDGPLPSAKIRCKGNPRHHLNGPLDALWTPLELGELASTDLDLAGLNQRNELVDLAVAVKDGGGPDLVPLIQMEYRRQLEQFAEHTGMPASVWDAFCQYWAGNRQADIISEG